MFKSICIGLFTIFFLIPTVIHAADSKRFKVVWFANLNQSPSAKNSPFWLLSKALIEATAQDLDINLTIVYSDGNHFKVVKEAERILSDETTRPDAILFHNYKHSGIKLLQIAEAHQVKSLVFNAGFAADADMGAPREKYQHWIGEIYPDDHYAGWLLAKTLMQEAKKLKRNNTSLSIQAIGFAGSKLSQASELRIQGLKKYQKETSPFNLINIIHADWSKDKVKKMTPLAIERHKDLHVFWTASDRMAQGVIEGATTKGWETGKDYVVGGVDCLPETQKMIKNGQFTASVGGHYTDIVLAIIIIHDYLKGIDFAASEGTTIYTKMFALTHSNYSKYNSIEEKFTKKSLHKIDFTQYSKWYNKKLKKYNFNAEEFLLK